MKKKKIKTHPKQLLFLNFMDHNNNEYNVVGYKLIYLYIDRWIDKLKMIINGLKNVIINSTFLLLFYFFFCFLVIILITFSIIIIYIYLSRSLSPSISL